MCVCLFVCLLLALCFRSFFHFYFMYEILCICAFLQMNLMSSFAQNSGSLVLSLLYCCSLTTHGFSLYYYQLICILHSTCFLGLRRRYGDKSLQADGAIQSLKDMIPKVEILQFYCLFACSVVLYVIFNF